MSWLKLCISYTRHIFNLEQTDRSLLCYILVPSRASTSTAMKLLLSNVAGLQLRVWAEQLKSPSRQSTDHSWNKHTTLLHFITSLLYSFLPRLCFLPEDGELSRSRSCFLLFSFSFSAVNCASGANNGVVFGVTKQNLVDFRVWLPLRLIGVRGTKSSSSSLSDSSKTWARCLSAWRFVDDIW